MIEDLATKIDIKEVAMNKTTSVDDKHSKTFPILVPETWAVASENRQKTQEKDDGSEGKIKADMKEDIRRKVSNDQRKKNSFTHIPETWAVATERQRETQEMEGDKEGKDQDDVHNKEAEQISEREDDNHVGHVDPKDVITTSIEENNGCEAHEIKEIATKNDIESEMAMDQETRDGDGKASHEDPKDVIKTSIKDTTVKTVNNNMRLNHESGQREKHRAWSRKDLGVGMHLKVLHGVVDIIIQIKAWGEKQKTKMCEGSKCLEQGDDRDKGGTCIKPKRIGSKEEQGTMIKSDGKAKEK